MALLSSINKILSYPILSYPILSYPILSYPILSYPILVCMYYIVFDWFWLWYVLQCFCLLTQYYYHRGTHLNATKRFRLCSL